ncbi:MAG: sigma-70 family RNA polymerase sigma factor [Patescibacteria group bacterium]
MSLLDEKEIMSDEEIVRLALNENAFFGHIVERYEDKLGRYVTRLGVRTVEDRQDVLQEIFIKVYRNLNAFNPDLSFSSWIYRIAHNEAISWYRKRNVRPEGHLVGDSDEILGIIASENDSSEVQFDKAINAVELESALMLVDEKYKQVLILRFFEHKEYEEISDILKIPVGSVGTLIHRGKKQLRDKINIESVRI